MTFVHSIKVFSAVRTYCTHMVFVEHLYISATAAIEVMDGDTCCQMLVSYQSSQMSNIKNTVKGLLLG